MNDPTYAFPFSDEHGAYPGMTLRDYLAAKAITALSQQWLDITGDQKKAYSDCVDSDIIWGRDFENFIAKMSYRIADAMLKARETKKE